MKLRGWAMIGNARVFHLYDADGDSLCGKYRAFLAPDVAFEPHEPTAPQGQRDCVSCFRRAPKEAA